MDEARLLDSIETAAEFEFSRSGGPGGQNVNKVNTKATLRVALASLDGLSEAERLRVETVLAPRIADGRVMVSVSDERTQGANRKLAVERLCALVADAARIPKPRRKTKPTAASVKRRLTEKRARSSVKRGRADSPPED